MLAEIIDGRALARKVVEDVSAGMVKDDPAWEVHRADASHDVMTDQPEQLCELLLDLGQRSS